MTEEQRRHLLERLMVRIAAAAMNPPGERGLIDSVDWEALDQMSDGAFLRAMITLEQQKEAEEEEEKRAKQAALMREMMEDLPLLGPGEE